MTPFRELVARRAQQWRDEPAYRASVRAALVRPWRVRQFDRFGEGSVLHKPLWIYGPHKVDIGANVLILEGAWLAVERVAWDRPGPAIVIGDGAALRPWLTISAASRIEIGEDVVFGGQCTIIDSDHTWRDGNPNVLYNPVISDPITIGAGTWLGDRVTVLRGSTIGERCAIGAHSVVKGDIPAGSVAVGTPARVVGRTVDL